ncbi:hypothetical protein [Nocardioides sp.]|uniref:hypothetical protein n=1 Tax=Nocardioides sp. TaxID=35761 RepID=UPI003527CEB1
MPTTSPAPAGRTARRLEWRFLPPEVRELVEARCGSAVVEAVSQGGGFTPGFASVLTCADGSRHFVKAASTRAQRPIADSYREEARKLRALPAGLPAARLQWSLDDEWVVLGLEYAEGRAPRRPWRVAELNRCLDALEDVAARLTPVPDGLELATFADDFADFAAAWDDVLAGEPALPGMTASRLETAATLARGFAEATSGDTVVHTDVRDDNLLLGDQVVICDWNWLATGADWLDTVFLLLGPRGDGLDVEAVLRERELTRGVADEQVDIVLALLVGYFLRQRELPAPPSSPYLRQHQAWCAETSWEWLAERRGWS